ncbi:MAG: phosphodiester glycosidase family protein, partial [Microcoleus sp.]
MKRKLFDRPSILFISILPLWAIGLICVGNSPGKAQASERAGLIHDLTVRRGINSPSHSSSRLKPTEIPTDRPFDLLQNQLPNFPVSQSVPPSTNIRQGRQVSINGRIVPLAWTQQPASNSATNTRTWIADVGLMQSAGVDLLNTADSSRQPVQWFAVSLTEARSLAVRST